ncbi:MAG: hypothetical protein HFE78_07335 [Clostridiales bacterium]|nr:hypothetical protein [Clostridiales bacterium]
MKAKKVVGIICLVIALVGIILIITGQGEIIEAAVPACIFGLLGLILIKPKSKKKIEREKMIADKKAAEVGQKERLKVIKSKPMEHMCGLPNVPEGAVCEICLCEQQYAFVRNGTEYKLSFEKVTDVSVKTETEIRNSYVSSVGGAVGGAVLFGPLGAMVGGRTKKKTDKTIHRYLTFAYQKEEETSFISFDCTNQSALAFECQRIFDSQEHSQKTVDL